MMKMRQTISTLTLILFLSGALLAASARVGVVRVEKGSVTLNGMKISAPQLLEQGQTLVLAQGAAARLQLLGGGGEVVLVGPKTVKVDATALVKQAKSVQRGAVASVPDIGNTTRGATATIRRFEANKKPFRISAPPQESQAGWTFPVNEGELFAARDKPELVEWAIFALNIDASSNKTAFRRDEVLSGEYLPGKERLEVPREKLQPGTRYLLCVTVSDRAHWSEIDYYEQPFRLLTENEAAYLKEVRIEMTELAEKEQSALALVDLASLLLDWDQLPEAQQVMEEAKRHPKWAELGPEVQDKADRFDRQLKKIWGLP